jgi:hypothetical protein
MATPKDVGSLDPHDSRREWQVITPENGLTLRQAMVHHADPELAEEFLRTVSRFDPDASLSLAEVEARCARRILGAGFSRVYRSMRSQLLVRLAAGELVAKGYAAHSGLDEPAEEINPDRWRALRVDFDGSRAMGAGAEISGILVYVRSAQAPARSNKVASAMTVKRWYRDWVKRNVAEGRQPSRDEDMAAAREGLHRSVSRDVLRGLRRELAPLSWREHGRRKNPAG